MGREVRVEGDVRNISDEVNDDRLGRALDSIYPEIENIEADVALKIMS